MNEAGDLLNLDKGHKDNLTDLLSDRQWYHPARVVAQYHMKYSPVYLHFFTKEPRVSLFDRAKPGFEEPHRAGHGDQVQFLFPYTPFPEIPLDSEFSEFSQDFVKIWVSIATNQAIPDGLGVESWEAAKEEDKALVWYQIDDKPLRRNIQPFTERMTLWDDLPLDLLYP